MTEVQQIIAVACEEAGLRVLGPTDAPGLENGVLVHNSLIVTDKRLGDRYRTTPNGPHHTLVRQPRPYRGQRSGMEFT